MWDSLKEFTTWLDSPKSCLVYFVLTLFAACKGGNVGLTLVVLASWADDEDEEDEGSFHEALLEKTFSKRNSLETDSHRNCFPLRFVHIGSRQRIVILVTVVVFVIMVACAVIIWIGMGKNPIDSAVVARVYVDLFAIAILLLGGALACYGVLLCLRMRNVRSERASSEMWKVAGSSIPSAFVLWIVRELPPSITANIREEPTTLTFVSDGSTSLQHPQSWTTAMSLRNQYFDVLLRSAYMESDDSFLLCNSSKEK
ncbi:hypothetical protein Prudu_011238 [Prunus dulcis]|uniref:Uncharacterized protein n=1 Tax=Prunus dulcis TaxID=3755 RepID=A0A4Y1RA53_PRUDU|nr:hypothetical protein Prudu_011238 [Prunus dulcis]